MSDQIYAVPGAIAGSQDRYPPPPPRPEHSSQLTELLGAFAGRIDRTANMAERLEVLANRMFGQLPQEDSDDRAGPCRRAGLLGDFDQQLRLQDDFLARLEAALERLENL